MTPCNPCNVSDSGCVPECEESEKQVISYIATRGLLLEINRKQCKSAVESKYVAAFEKNDYQAVLKLYKELKGSYNGK